MRPGRKPADLIIAWAALLLAACVRPPGRLERAIPPAHAAGDIPIAGPVGGGTAGAHDGHVQGRAATRLRTR